MPQRLGLIASAWSQAEPGSGDRGRRFSPAEVPVGATLYHPLPW